MGDRITISGNIQNSNLNIKSTLTNVQQSISALHGGDAADRNQLQTLIGQLQSALEAIPAEHKDQAEAVAASAQAMVENAKAEKPNKVLLQISGEGLKKAAESLAGTAPAVVSIAGQIVTAVMRLHGFA